MTLVLIASQANGSLQDRAGNAQTKATEFRNLDGTAPSHFDGSLVTHYADDAGTDPLTTPITPDNRGRLMRFIEAGQYKQIIDGESLDFHALPGSVGSEVAAATAALPTKIDKAIVQAGTAGAPTETEIFRFTTPNTDLAPFTWHVHGATFNGTFDPVMYFGYNTAGAGGRVDTGEPSFRFVIEADYEVTPDVHWLEAYFEFFSAAGVGARPIFWRFDKAGTIVGFDIKSKGISFTWWDDDVVFLGMDRANFALTSNTAHGLTQRAASGQVAIHGFYIGAGGTPAFQLMALSQTAAELAVNGNVALRLYDSSRAAIGVNANSAGLTIMGNAGNPALKTMDEASPFGDHYQALANNGTTIYSRFSKAGYFMTRKTAAPPDADIANGEMALWFDSTNGAAKLMVKAKQADGTVRTAAVALA